MMLRDEQRLESCDIHGGKIIIVGDLHLSSSFRGSHRDYLYECYHNFDLIRDALSREKAGAIIFLGDLIGVVEKSIKDRQFMMRTLMFFSMLNNITNGHVYSVRGNHDNGDFTDFDLLLGLGLIKNPKVINYYGRRPGNTEDDGLEIRFHLVNYGDEHKSLNVTTEDNLASNVVLGHSDYYIDGVTNWYSKGKNIEVSELNNFAGVSLIISGHIHEPSDEVLYTTIKTGEPIGLFFTGAPGRVSERYDDCWYLVFEYMEGEGPEDWSTSYDARFMGLQSANEVYFEDENIIGTEEQKELSQMKDSSATLTTIVNEIIEGRITSGDLNHQIDVVPGVSDDIKTLAKQYLEKATQEI